MSSTNRSEARKSHVSDYYVTPILDIVNFLHNIEETELYKKFVCKGGDYVLDPCAGGDNSHLMSYPEALKQVFPTVDVCTIDIRLDSLAEIKTDYLNYDFQDMQRPCIIITNPPFNIAQQVIEKALLDVVKGGYIIMLLRLNFFGSKGRFDFWKKQMPVLSYVHSQRMSFTDNKKTDSIEYMHCIWQQGVYPEFVKVKVI